MPYEKRVNTKIIRVSIRLIPYLKFTSNYIRPNSVRRYTRITSLYLSS